MSVEGGELRVERERILRAREERYFVFFLFFLRPE